jgi:hypothetical protein
MPEVNWLAILVAGVASMVLGFLWYGPLFGKMWATMMGWDKMNPADVEAKKKGASIGYVVSFIGSLVMAYVLSHVIAFSESFGNPAGLSTGLMTGLWMWLGFVAPVTLGSVLWDGKPLKLWFLNNGYNLLHLLILGAILASWK